MKKAISLVSLVFSAAIASPVLSASPHGLDDSNTNGANGYTIGSSGEAFLGDNLPRSAVWEKIWGLCDDKHCDGSFQIGNEWPVCVPGRPNVSSQGGVGPGDCKPKDGTVTVTVNGDYAGRNGWETRAAFMEDLQRHHFGDGGVYSNGDAAWGQGFGYPPGWWVAADTYIRHPEGQFWVNVRICPPACG